MKYLNCKNLQNACKRVSSLTCRALLDGDTRVLDEGLVVTAGGTVGVGALTLGTQPTAHPAHRVLLI